jgi:phosphatidylinositol alpha-1,6-mannosyltransferase
VGGAHGWLYQVYRRWPDNAVVLTGVLGGGAAAAAATFDSVAHGTLSIRRILPATPDISVASLAYWRALLSQIRSIRSVSARGPLRLHALRAFPEGIAALCCKLRNPARSWLVTYAHGEEMSIARSSRQLRAACRLVYHGSDLVIANSRNTERLVREMAPKARVTCIHPGVDTHAIAPDPTTAAHLRQTLPWSADTLVLCTVARMEPRKNQAAVIAAVARLRGEGMPVAYICAGDGPEAMNLRRAAAAAGMTDYVMFPGQVSDTQRNAFMQACDVCIMPSIQAGNVFEGFGMVFLEAAAAGRPSIAGNSGGQPEAVLHGETGLVVDGSNQDEICAAITHMMDPAARLAMGGEARLWAARNDWSMVASRTLAAIEAMVAPRSHAA